MEVEEELQECLRINTHKGLYRYNRLVLGISSAPAIWQRSLDQILEGIEVTGCILDDVILTGKDDEEQPNHLEEVLKSLKEHGLRAIRDKSEFFLRKITYCGHEVDKHRPRKTQEKVDPYPTKSVSDSCDQYSMATAYRSAQGNCSSSTHHQGTPHATARPSCLSRDSAREKLC